MVWAQHRAQAAAIGAPRPLPRAVGPLWSHGRLWAALTDWYWPDACFRIDCPVLLHGRWGATRADADWVVYVRRRLRVVE